MFLVKEVLVLLDADGAPEPDLLPVHLQGIDTSEDEQPTPWRISGAGSRGAWDAVQILDAAPLYLSLCWYVGGWGAVKDLQVAQRRCMKKSRTGKRLSELSKTTSTYAVRT